MSSFSTGTEEYQVLVPTTMIDPYSGESVKAGRARYQTRTRQVYFIDGVKVSYDEYSRALAAEKDRSSQIAQSDRTATAEGSDISALASFTLPSPNVKQKYIARRSNGSNASKGRKAW